ncbi:MAG: hypothetical protein RLZ04_28 [Actinomycetota bacterium]
MARDMVDDRLMRSVDLWTRVAALPEYASATGVMAFVGFRGEPDTDPLFARLAVDGKRLLLPRVEGPDIVVCDGAGPMQTSGYGVSEPTGPALGADVVDLVIVPGLAFTLDGGRLGYGGGFYDRFLPTLRNGVISVGVCFDEQVVDHLPVEAHDIRVARVVSA